LSNGILNLDPDLGNLFLKFFSWVALFKDLLSRLLDDSKYLKIFTYLQTVRC